MDHIEFRVTRLGATGSVEIFVNEAPLVDALREHELPMATAEGNPSIAGSYVGLPLTVLDGASNHFLGEPDPMFSYDDKTEVLVCGSCGEPGCWPLLVKIIVLPTEVVWSDFEQPHRRGQWRYDGFGPFHFSREQYAQSLSQACQVRAG